VCSRVYPKGQRVDSSNISDVNVCRAWDAGVQMVALNFQYMDGGLMTNQVLRAHSMH